MAVPMNVPKLLKKERLAMQLYCLRGSSLKHKVIANFDRLIKQLENDELLLAIRYPQCNRHQKDRVLRHVGKERDCGVGKTVFAGIPNTSRPLCPAAYNGPQDEPAQMTVPAPTCHTLDGLFNTQHMHTSPSESSSTVLQCSATSTHQQAGHDSPRGTEQWMAQGSTIEYSSFLGMATPPSGSVRFPHSGSVFTQLLRQYDLHAAEIEARKYTQEKTKEKARPLPWRELMWMNLVGAHMMPPLLVRHVVLDLHRDGIPRLCGDASLPVQVLMWTWTGVTLCLYYASSWAPAGWVRQADPATSSHRRCHQCHLDVPREAHHCQVCEVCVLDRHHHSYLTGSCVGRGNVRAYRLLCVLGAVGGLVCAAVVGAGALLFGKDVLSKDWMVGGMAVAIMLAGVGAHASVRHR